MMRQWMAGAAMLWACLAGSPAAAEEAHVKTLDGRALTAPAIAEQVHRLMTAANVTGLGVAVIRDGKVVFRRSFGLRNVAERLPLEQDTVMYGASLTKATFAYFVMQLVDEGKVDLDRPIAAYLPKPLPDYEHYAALADDSRWRKLTLRILLDHSSGLANFAWMEPDKKIRLHWEPGSRYAYSGEGIMLAQFVLQEGLGIDVAAQMQRRLFDRFGMKRTSLVWRDDFAANYAETYGSNGELVEHDRRSTARVAGSMDTTLTDWSDFLAAVSRGEGLSAKAKAEMIRRQIGIDSSAQFPTLRDWPTDRDRAIKLGYGLGWGVFETPYGHAYFKEGHDDGTTNYAVCIEERRDCLLLMSNSVRAEGIYKALVEYLMGDIHMPWQWEGYVPFDAPVQQ